MKEDQADKKYADKWERAGWILVLPIYLVASGAILFVASWVIWSCFVNVGAPLKLVSEGKVDKWQYLKFAWKAFIAIMVVGRVASGTRKAILWALGKKPRDEEQQVREAE